ncbi:hypothetical protein JL720_3284 [Aureococcus anophagefferens]|nr:hypothetical protein JL720_3284 [Aureococcus anophagefferens]
MAVTSSTKGELFLVSKASQSVLRRVELDVKAESLCAVPGTRRVLVADGRGTLCCVDTATEPATVACVAGSAHHAGAIASVRRRVGRRRVPPRARSAATRRAAACGASTW